MKKKLLVCVVLFLISNNAGALTNLYLTDSSANNEIGLWPPADRELLLWYTGDPIISFDVEVEVIGPGTISGGEITATGSEPLYHILLFPDGYNIELGATAVEGYVLGAGFATPLATIDYHADDFGSVILQLHDVMTLGPGYDQISPICHSMIVNQIPEPTTVILLGLGGLLFGQKR